MAERKVRVLVVGSVNHDQTAFVASLPRPGETVLAASVLDSLGGKGANQAVAASRAGTEVWLLGAVGDDASGRMAREQLEGYGVRLDLLRVDLSTSTGSAFVTVDANGENAIVVGSGANATVTPDDVARAAVLPDVTVVVAQGELPVAATAAAAAFADRAGGRFVLNLAPAQNLPDEVLAAADPLIVNEHEAAAMTTGVVPSTREAALECAAELARSARSVVVTLGELGAVAVENRDHPSSPRAWHQPLVDAAIEVLDTTGAGDALTGILAAHLTTGQNLAAALRAGVAGASLAVTRPGTIAAYPSRREIEAALARADGQ